MRTGWRACKHWSPSLSFHMVADGVDIGSDHLLNVVVAGKDGENAVLPTAGLRGKWVRVLMNKNADLCPKKLDPK